ncbi:MAG: hypothetical protein ACO1N1_09240 [Dyadobacter fermentans]
MAYQIHTYKDVLETLARIEKEENELRNSKIRHITIGAVLGIIIISALFQLEYFEKMNWIDLITGWGASVIIGPFFSFTYYLTQADAISARKQDFFDSLSQSFQATPSPTLFQNGVLDRNELNKIVHEKITEKLNETPKHEY